jgi:hypothetical protein
MEPSVSDVTIECPWCGGSSLERVHRRLVDRLISLAWPQLRYCCQSLGCEWQGNRSAAGLRSPRVVPKQLAQPDRPTVSEDSAPRPADAALVAQSRPPLDWRPLPRESLDFKHLT